MFIAPLGEIIAGYKVNPILFPTKKEWDNIEIYRSTMIKENGTYRIWYSVRGKGERWHIGYTEIKQSQLNNISMS